MIKTPFRILLVAGIVSALGMATGCAGSDSKPAATKGERAVAKSGSALPNYRYVDLDTILSRYNLAKDFTEDDMRRQNSIQAELKRHENSIITQQSAMQNKMKNNRYTSEADFKADEQRLNQMQSSAQQTAGKLQEEYQNAMMAAQKTLNDSIQSFIKDYNAAHHYDAILYKAATLYIDPALDITDDVVEGLNARYNKVKK